VSQAKLQSLLQGGLVHHRAGRLPQAELLYRQARALAPKSFDALHLSGLLAYQQARIAEAIELLGRAHRIEPQAHTCEMRYAVALLAARRGPEAEKHLRHAVTVKPDFHEAWDNLAYGLKLQDRLSEAVACHERSVALKPDHAPGWYNFGLTLASLGRLKEALACHDRARAADPSYALAIFGRAQALHRANRIAEAVAEYGRFIARQPRNLEARSHRLMAMLNLPELSAETIFAEHVAYGRAAEAVHGAATGLATRAEAVPASEGRADARKLRVAILSPDLREHSCAYFLEPLLEHLPADGFEVLLYHDHFREDAVSRRLAARAAQWRNFIGQPAETVEATIRADAPDILVDLAGHTGMSNRLPLFVRRLAPLQVTYLGYPDTTGLTAMDVRLTDEIADPAGSADRRATEKLVRFAPCAWTYRPTGDAPEVAPSPGRANGGITFGSFNSVGKVTDRTLACWARLLARVPGARLLLKGEGFQVADEREAFLARLVRAGFSPEAVELVGRTPDTRSHLALYGRVDIALDPWPYNGTTTTCEALWMGVPVVTLTGERHIARVGTSLVTAAGHPEWAAASEADYERIAVDLAHAPERLAAIRAGLRADLARGPLLDHAGQARRWAAALRAEWRARVARPERTGAATARVEAAVG
jgi:predicted O-linked N-acetylglucosamine transferase (SPINDLY family)